MTTRARIHARSAVDRATTASPGRTALIFGGGIGDYLHYLARLDALLRQEGLKPADVTLFVESTVPAMVRSLFASALPEFAVSFVPPQIHWTKTHPLLDVLSEYDRVNRPAYRFVAAQGYRRIIDWFLPFCCDHFPETDGRLLALTSRNTRSTDSVVVSLRDKGFLWWPCPQVLRDLRRLAAAHDFNVVLLGTEVERPLWLDHMTTASDVLTALQVSADAKLFVGTDTGLATIRELLARPNVYCVSLYWFEDVMLKYGYMSHDRLATSGSRVTFDPESCLEAVAALLGVGRSRVPAAVHGGRRYRSGAHATKDAENVQSLPGGVRDFVGRCR